eukprot:3191328-Rhodomonas_salina.1
MRAWERATQASRDTARRRRQKRGSASGALLTRQADTSRKGVGTALGTGGSTVRCRRQGDAGAQKDLLLGERDGSLQAMQVLLAFAQNGPGFAHGLLRVPDGGKGPL